MRDFEADLKSLFGDKMKKDDEFCAEVWSALANIIWKNDDAEEFDATFRYAGGLIADIIGRGDYMDWYCCGVYGSVSMYIEKRLATLGWTPHYYD